MCAPFVSSSSSASLRDRLRAAWLPLTLCALSFCVSAFGQEPVHSVTQTATPLITQPIDESQLTVLKGNTHPLARPQFDLGKAPATQPMERMLLVLKRSGAQETALRKLLDDQQDKNSPSYHKWMTAAQFGAQFGPTDVDIQTIKSWLQSHGFQVGTTNGRTVLEFSGSASQVQEAFHTTIHKYIVNGEPHWANANDPSIPSALVPAVAGIASLNNFPRKAMNVPLGTMKQDKATGKLVAVKPMVTEPGGCTPANECYGLGPYDFATIYNLTPLWNAGIDGTGVTIAISGETDIQMSDVQTFRSVFGLPSNNPVFVYNGPDPGIQGDESEADIDVQWSGAVAKGATIDFVISESTETTSGVDLSAVYIVDQNLAPIMSESYGECELGLGTTGNQFYNALWQQASAEGITVFISAGDAGSAGCDDFDAQPPAPAQYGLQVSGYASTPYNVAVGGTDFNDFSNSASYWGLNNQSGTLQSALSYIPESTWNDSCTNGLFADVGFSSNAETNCNNPQLAGYVEIIGGSGGVSACTTPSGQTPASCAGGYTRPSWQTGNGSFSDDGKRDLPDVSLFASNGFVGEVYLICQSDQGFTCQDVAIDESGGFGGFGGTSVSSPAFAGIMALINQKTGSRQGNANYVFYKLAAKTGASCTSSASEASSCIFNDVTVGTNAGPCATGSPDCQTSTAGDAYGVMSGYNAAAGYDMATGLGSVNANNLVNAWSTVTTLPSVTTLTNVSPTTITHGEAVNFTASVAPESGTGTPTGLVSLESGLTSATVGVAGFTLTNGTVTGSTEMLPGGTYSLTAYYPGDSTYAPSTSSPISVTVNKENSQPQAYLVTFGSNGTILSSNTNTAVYGSLYLLRVNVDNSAGKLCAPAASTGATACPTGTVTMTDNGSALDAGNYTLNSYGYFEDQTVQLSGGTNSIQASYAGDASFNASSATTPITITPVGTSMTTVAAGYPTVGTILSANVNVSADSSGVAPTGTVTFLVNGTAVSGQVTYNGTPGSGTNPTTTLSANITSSTSPFTAAGTYTMGASYSGDQNYAASTAPTTSITVQYPAPQATINPQTQNVNPGGTASLSALVDTTNKTVYPTGTITFLNWQTGAILAGPTTCTSTKDSSGNYACQASASLTVTSAIFVSAQYSGDTNYPATTTGTAQIIVNDFSLNGGSTVTTTQGASSQTTIYVTALGAFNGAVSNFSCSGLPAEATCSFNPTTVTGGGSTTVTITTAALGQSLQMRRRAASEGPRGRWIATVSLPLLGLCLIGIPAWRRRRGGLTLLLLITTLLLLTSCGGSGTTPPPNNPAPAISSLSPTQQAAGSLSQMVSITGSGFISSSNVTYNNAAHSATYVSPTQLSMTLGTSDLAAQGTYPVVVTNPGPGGGSSSAVDFNVVSGTPTGTFTVTVSASSGSLSHTTTFTLAVQ